ncbi:MAG: hypothetical protein H0T13_08985, partial [Actinobacteria bacterium]|nr:hypothetical protein [Actinomycetota bacterium]
MPWRDSPTGKTSADIEGFLADPESLEGGPPEWIEDVGGVPTLSQDEEVSITRELERGTYVMLCFVPAPDGRPHIAHGMVKTFEVGEAGAAALPEPDAVVTATDESFEIPALEAGTQTLELRNDAASSREFYLYSPNEGVTLAQVEEWGEGGFRGEALATFLGAMQSIPPGSSVFLHRRPAGGQALRLLRRGARGRRVQRGVARSAQCEQPEPHPPPCASG